MSVMRVPFPFVVTSAKKQFEATGARMGLPRRIAARNDEKRGWTKAGRLT